MNDESPLICYPRGRCTNNLGIDYLLSVLARIVASQSCILFHALLWFLDAILHIPSCFVHFCQWIGVYESCWYIAWVLFSWCCAFIIFSLITGLSFVYVLWCRSFWILGIHALTHTPLSLFRGGRHIEFSNRHMQLFKPRGSIVKMARVCCQNGSSDLNLYCWRLSEKLVKSFLPRRHSPELYADL